MLHGMAFTGFVIITFSAAAYCLWNLPLAYAAGEIHQNKQTKHLSWITWLMAIALWLSLLIALFIVFPQYRIAPPQGQTDLTHYPRYLLLKNPNTAWLHTFAMEAKEHMAWIAALILTAVASMASSSQHKKLDASVRSAMAWLLIISFGIVSFLGLLGVFVNKVAPIY